MQRKYLRNVLVSLPTVQAAISSTDEPRSISRIDEMGKPAEASQSASKL
jgi:hypothetical protein